MRERMRHLLTCAALAHGRTSASRQCRADEDYYTDRGLFVSCLCLGIYLDATMELEGAKARYIRQGHKK